MNAPATEMALLLRTHLSFSELTYSKREVCDGTLATEKQLCSPPHWRKHKNNQTEYGDETH